MKIAPIIEQLFDDVVVAGVAAVALNKTVKKHAFLRLFSTVHMIRYFTLPLLSQNRKEGERGKKRTTEWNVKSSTPNTKKFVRNFSLASFSGKL